MLNLVFASRLFHRFVTLKRNIFWPHVVLLRIFKMIVEKIALWKLAFKFDISFSGTPASHPLIIVISISIIIVIVSLTIIALRKYNFLPTCAICTRYMQGARSVEGEAGETGET